MIMGVMLLATALETVVQLACGGTKELCLTDGVYRLEKTLVLGPDAAGLRIRAEHPGKAVISGSVAVRGWRAAGDGKLLVAEVPEAKNGLYFRALTVNGRMADRSEYPGGGKELKTTCKWTVRWLNSVGNGWERPPTHEELTTVKVHEGDIPNDLDVASADVRVYHLWDNSLVRAASYNSRTREIRLAEECLKPPGSFKCYGYVIYNVRAGLRHPGQWYLDTRAGQLFYWPREGETADTLSAEIPLTTTLVSFEKVSDLTFEGLVFENTKPSSKKVSFGGVGIEGAVSGKRSDRVVFRDCTFRNNGSIALVCRGSDGYRIENCQFEDSGSCSAFTDGRNGRIVNSHFLRSGRIFTSACAYYLSGAAQYFANNEIADAPYCGVCYNGRGHLFESNTVTRIMQLQRDGAAFYGMSHRTVFRGNRVYDNKPATNERHAFYYDEGSTDGLVYDNYVEGGFMSIIHNHISRNITISNNVFRTPGTFSVSFKNSRGGVFVNNRLEAAKGFGKMPDATSMARWAGNRFFVNGVETNIELTVKILPRMEPLPVPRVTRPPTIGSRIKPKEWPGKWTGVSRGRQGESMGGSPHFVRACHDDTNLYVAVRLPRFSHEEVCTGGTNGLDRIQLLLPGLVVKAAADGTATNVASYYAGVEYEPKKRTFGKNLLYILAVPLSEVFRQSHGSASIPFNLAIYDAQYCETRFFEAPAYGRLSGTLQLEDYLALQWIDVIPNGCVSKNPQADAIARIGRFTPHGNPVVDTAADFLKTFTKDPKKPTGILLQCTIGHGGVGAGGRTPWQLTVEPRDGYQPTRYRLCPLDPNFLAYLANVSRALGGAHPAFFMVDDDVRLEGGCFCPLHLAAFSKLTGQNWTLEELRDALAADASLARRWRAFTTDTIAAMLQVIRDGFPAEIPGMFCTVDKCCDSGAKLARILAGPRHRPRLRIGCAPYWNNDPNGILDVLGRVAHERAAVADAEVAVLQESDTCPHTRWRTSATRLVEFQQLLAFAGLDGAKMWITPTSLARQAQEHCAWPKYAAALAVARGNVRLLSRGIAAEGVVIPLPARAKQGLVFSGDWGREALGRLGIPYRYGEPQTDEVVALSGLDAPNFTDAEIAALLKRPLLLDQAASEQFKKRGFAEALAGANVKVFAQKIVAYPQPWHQQKFLTESARQTIVQAIRELNGGKLPGGVRTLADGSYLVLTGRDTDGARVVVVDNLDLDEEESLALALDQVPKSIEFADDGVWEPVKFAYADGIAKLDLVARSHRPQVLRIKF